LALLYALLDEERLDVFYEGRCAIDAKHVRAAAELVGRSRQTVEWFLNRPTNGNTISSADVQKVRTETNKNAGQITASQLRNIFPNKGCGRANRSRHSLRTQGAEVSCN
jgi:hypothetical protein